MPSIGDATKPNLVYWESWSSGTAPNQAAMAYTMPERGRIERLGGWAAGVNETVSTRLVLWDSAGAVLGQSAAFTMASQTGAAGHVANYEADLTTPVELDEGATFYVGISRDPAKSHQLTGRSSAAGQRHYDNRRGTWPGTIIPNDGGSHGFGDYSIGMYVASYVAIRGGWVYRSGVWVRAEQVLAYRSGAWVEVATVNVYRSGAWIEAD